MLEQRTGVYDNPYKFNTKELDRETGLYYYGARYYNPRASIWYGVDPLVVYNTMIVCSTGWIQKTLYKELKAIDEGLAKATVQALDKGTVIRVKGVLVLNH